MKANVDFENDADVITESIVSRQVLLGVPFAVRLEICDTPVVEDGEPES